MIRLPARAFLAIVSQFAAPVVAETPYEYDLRLSQIKTWDEACVVFDCSQFPQGYSTWLLGDDYYYFRLEAIQPPPEPGQIDFRDHDPMVGRFIERDAEGRITRSFMHNRNLDNISFNHCCKWLLDQVGLLGQWPDFKHDRFSSDHDNNDPALHRMRWDIAQLRLTSARKTSNDILMGFFPINPDGTRQYTLDLADKSGWISLNDDFWLVDFGEDVRESRDVVNRWRMVTILSKEPMFNGRYIYGYCDSHQTCLLHSVVFGDDNARPGISIIGLRADEYKATPCADRNPVLNCDNGLEFFDKLKPAFHTLELMFERLQTRPAGIDRPKE